MASLASFHQTHQS